MNCYSEEKYGSTKKGGVRNIEKKGIYDDCPEWLRITDNDRHHKPEELRSILVIDKRTKKAEVFPTLGMAAKSIGVTAHYVSGMLFSQGFCHLKFHELRMVF